MKLAFEVNLHISSNRRDHPATARADARGEISLDQIESGYQKLADPEVSRVVITRF